jgi:hypothetical protein
MGLVPCNAEFHNPRPSPYCYAPADNPDGGSSLPDYSTEIGAAWEVFLEIERRLFSTRDRFYGALALEARLKDGASPHGFWGLGVLKNRFPEAICLAALKAVGAEIPEA